MEANVLTWASVAAFALVPLLFVATTSFVKLAFVFSILRNALGTGQVPSALVVTALAGILSVYVMAPVAERILDASAEPAARVDWQGRPLAGESAAAVWDTLQAGAEPLRVFLDEHAGDREQALFVELLQHDGASRPPQADELLVVMPAFLITELKEAFQIGFLVYVPFLVIDLVVSNILLALGMHMMAPTTISLPFKLLLFVLVDGWYLLSEALIVGYR